MFSLYTKLVETKSSNDKIAILKSYSGDSIVKMALWICYEPFFHTYLNNVPKPKSIGHRKFRESFDDFVSICCDLNDRKITGNLAKDTVRSFLESVDEESQLIYPKLIKKDLKAGIAEKTLLKAFGDNFVNVFEVQLGEPYDPERQYKVSKTEPVNAWFVSTKLDGIRGYQEDYDINEKLMNCSDIPGYTHIIKEVIQKQWTGNPLRTRNGNKIFGFDHILNEILDLKTRYELNLVDGELYEMGIPFQTITSYVNADKNIIPEHKEKIKFYIFAVGRDPWWIDTYEMVNYMRGIDWSRYQYLKLHQDYELIPNDSDLIFSKMLSAIDHGLEGLMLRHPIRCWVRGRSHDIVKVKPVYEGDFEVSGFEKGKPDGENANTLGAIIVTGEAKMSVKGKTKVFPIRSEVGSGFKKKKEKPEDVTRDDVWNNRPDWQSSIVEVHFSGVTDKPDKDGYYSLRFARFYRRRVDKVT